jgi:DNA-directed RNA polymerase specialized sigma24 family protein
VALFFFRLSGFRSHRRLKQEVPPDYRHFISSADRPPEFQHCSTELRPCLLRAEDAFQATFLILNRRAASLRPQVPLGGWLFSVAYRTAQKARITVARRPKYEGRACQFKVADPLAEITVREAQGILDRELARLPDKYRVPLVLCYLPE